MLKQGGDSQLFSQFLRATNNDKLSDRSNLQDEMDSTALYRTIADLEGGDASIGCRGARGEGRDGKDQGQSEERSGKHGRTVFAVPAGIP